MEETLAADIITFDYSEITDKNADLSDQIEKAYGLKGLGILIVKNVPGYVESREKLLPLSQKLATLPEKDLDSVTFKEHNYGIGWSHGKEKFLGKPDYSKGSFYFVASKDEKTPKNKEPNPLLDVKIWPEAIPELKDTAKDLGQLIIDVGVELAYHIDKHISKHNSNYESGKLQRIIKESDCNTGRLLHYFPQEKEKEETQWCGVHNDHGSLTGLCGAMYLDKDGKYVEVNDKTSGLFIYSRDGKEYKASIPKDALAFQIGESMQIHSGGLLRATPHLVKAGNKLVGTGISRNTLAVFMEPKIDELMDLPSGSKISDVCGHEIDLLPKMEYRFKEGMTFGQFGMATIKAFDSTM
jgi:isopenicillin N synthase-like dioxygenase